MDSFELNKIAAAILVALLVVKGADLISRVLVSPSLLKESAYKIAGATPSISKEIQHEPKGPAAIEPLLATADVTKGAEVFKKCISCHTIDKGGSNRVGPNLYGIVGAAKAKNPDYSYSSAMQQKGGTWTYSDLNLFLYFPRDFVPGTKMSFAGVKDDQERAAIIAYLRQQSDIPVALPVK